MRPKGSENERIARLETQVEVASDIHAGIDRSIERIVAIIEKHDARMDSMDARTQRGELLIARALGGLAMVILLANLLVPILVRYLLGDVK